MTERKARELVKSLSDEELDDLIAFMEILFRKREAVSIKTAGKGSVTA